MFVQVGNIAAANVYREDDRPNCECEMSRIKTG